MVALLALLLVRLWRLSEAPPNVTGDEVTFLNDILHILYSPSSVTPMSLMGDGSQSGINLYFMALVVRAFPQDDAILGMRVASSVLSVAVLGAFYLYLRTKLAAGPSLAAMYLLGTNYVFLNISRATWMGDGKGLGLICGLLSFIMVERAVNRRRWYLLIFGGALGGLALYSYLGTVLLPLASLAFLAYSAVRRRLESKLALKYMAGFSAVALLIFVPNLVSISQDYGRYALRSRSVFVGSMEETYYREKGILEITWHQVAYTFRGFLLLDPDVGGKGTENGRYVPVGEAPVDTATRALFLLGMPAMLFFRRRGLAQPALAFVIVLAATQVLTVLPPNYARGLFGLLFVYMVVAALLDRLWSFRLSKPYGRMALMAFVAIIGLWNLQHYFQWGASPQLASEREPAIEYGQVPLWVEVEKRNMADGQEDLVITSDVWQELVRGMAAGGENGGRLDGPGL